MTGLHITVLLFWAIPSFCQHLDIPLPAALLLRGEPLGFSESPHRHRRAELENVSEPVTCAGDEYLHPYDNHCCKKCLRGFRMHSHCPADGHITNCVACGKRTFTAISNYAKKCKSCNQCKSSLRQVELSSCSPDKDTVCGCPLHQYQIRMGLTFKCENCSLCQNGTALIPCRGYNDTFCNCFHGFFFDATERKCLSCEGCDHSRCRDHCPPTGLSQNPLELQGQSPLLFVFIGLIAVFVLLVGIGVVWKFRKKRIVSRDESEALPQKTPLMSPSETLRSLIPLPGHVVPASCDTHTDLVPLGGGLPLPDCVISEPRAQRMHNPAELYTLIESIPLGRWKEFVRRLGLSDNDIENSEQENKRYRDAQYDMLRVWMLRVGPSGATKDLVCRVLRDMELGGCIEKIQECL